MNKPFKCHLKQYVCGYVMEILDKHLKEKWIKLADLW